MRLGGAQVVSDFGMRPDLITYPLPELSASADVPSTVNVLVNGVSQLSEHVERGPFVVSSLPVVTGAGTVAVTVIDALGRQTLISLPFYASSAFAQTGWTAIPSRSARCAKITASVERLFGIAASQSSRLGTPIGDSRKPWEATRDFRDARGRRGRSGRHLGIVNVAAAASRRFGWGDDLRRFPEVASRLSVSASGPMPRAAFRDIAAGHGSPVPKSTITPISVQLADGAILVSPNRRVLGSEGRKGRPRVSPYLTSQPSTADRQLQRSRSPDLRRCTRPGSGFQRTNGPYARPSAGTSAWAAGRSLA